MTLKPDMFHCQIQTWSKGREGPSSTSTALIRVIPQVVEGRSTRIEVSPSLVVLDEGFHAGFRSHDWCWIWERNLNHSNVILSLWTISYRMHLGSCLIKYNIQYLRIKTYKVFFAVVNFDGLKTGLRWGSERQELGIVFFLVVAPPGGGWFVYRL